MKGSLSKNWSRIQQEKSTGSLSLLLGPLSGFYGAGVKLRLAAYRAGVFRSKRLPGFVISVGNLTVGGTGKTPAVTLLAEWAAEQGYRVAVLSRGHGGNSRKKVLEVTDGVRVKAGPQESGDEPHLIAAKLKGIPVVVSKKRYLAGSFALENFRSQVFILDDGFQHLELHRDLNLVLLDAANPFGNGHLLPWGPLREPIRQLKRGDAYILTRSEDPRREAPTAAFLRTNFPGRPVYRAVHSPEKLVFPFGEQREPEFLRGKRVLAFSGIARPESFRETLFGLGAQVEGLTAFEDHHPFTRDEIQSLIRRGEDLKVHFLVTTEKDWVRMAPLATPCRFMAYLSVRFSIRPEGGSLFEMIKRRMLEGEKQ